MKEKKFEYNNISYEKNICNDCKNYCYLSYIQCPKCFNKYCLLHMI